MKINQINPVKQTLQNNPSKIHRHNFHIENAFVRNTATEFTLQKFEEIIKFGNRFSFPLIWNPRLRKLVISPRHLVASIIIQFLLYAKTVAILGQTVLNKSQINSSYFNLLLLAFYCLLGISIGSSVLTLKPRDVESGIGLSSIRRKSLVRIRTCN